VFDYAFVFVYVFRLRFCRCFRFCRRVHSRPRFRIRGRVCFQSFFSNCFSFGLPISSRENGLRSACLLNSNLAKWLDRSDLPSDRRPRNLGKWAGTPLARQYCPGDQMPFARQSRPEAQMTCMGSKFRRQLFMQRSTIQFVGVPPLG
jgi:hypothetical protein